MFRLRILRVALLAALLSLPASARAGFVLLASFDHTNGQSPFAPLVRDSSGNLYGTTSAGGSGGFGTVFKISPNGTLTNLVSFDGGNNFPNGSYPESGLLRDSKGNLYGTTYGGGYPYQAGYGTVFQISPSGQLTYLYNHFNGFTGGASPSPYGYGLVMDSKGNLYGETYQGNGHSGTGVVFKLSPSGTLTNLASFTGPNGMAAEGGLIMDAKGNLYGTTEAGGASGNGTVFKISSDGTFTTLHSFNGTNDGANPQSGVIIDSKGNLYGTTTQGGSPYGDGTVYELSPNGTFTVLHDFNGNDGLTPAGGLFRDSRGDLFGTTTQAFHGSWGTVFELSANGTFTTLYSFNGATDGALPVASLITDGKGNLYGTTSSGGPGGYGTVFELTGVVPAATPEPTTLLLLGQGATALLGLAWRQRGKRLTPGA
jgi:uncharacterized repeat protein (TIGR03803 family)